jgi:hypothetical protein
MSVSHGDQTPNKSVPVLVCSANLGNACPDAASLNEWIPEDGRYDAVLQSQKYPIRDGRNGAAAVEATAHDRFLLVVIGMQEATWSNTGSQVGNQNTRSSLHSDVNCDVAAADATSADAAGVSAGGGGDAATTTDTGAMAAPGSTRSQSVPRRKQSITDKLARPVQRVVLSVRGLTASRDHTQSENRSRRQKGRSQRGRPGFVDPSEDVLDPLQRPSSVSQWDFGTQTLHQMFEERLPSYRRIVSYQRGEMRLVIFAHHSLVDASEVSVLHVAAQNTGRAGLANKGGIVAQISVKQTKMAFVTCHLEAHEGKAKYEIRCGTLADIFQGTRGKLHDVSMSSSHCFVLGDLNFRTELDTAEYITEDEHKQKVRDMVRQQDWDQLNRIDELHRALRNKDCLVGFTTLPCSFPPTFKVERRVGYEYNEKRRPSYTDRVLWKGRGLKPITYEPVDDFASSDHKPIRAAFMVPVHPRLRMRPRLSRHGASSSLERSLRWASIRSTRSTASVAHKNKLFLFVSQIRCSISPGVATGVGGPGSSSLPNPYVVLVSSPEATLRRTVRNWDKLKSLVRFGHTSSLKNADGSTLRLAFGWPRSCLKRGTNAPAWVRDDEEIQCQVQTHTRDGASIDLTGSLLCITVMNDAKGTLDPVIGSIQYDLAGLLKRCIRADGSASATGRDMVSRQAASTASTYKRSVVTASHTSSPDPAPEPTGDPSEQGHSPDPSRETTVRFSDVDRNRRKSQLQAAVRKASIINSIFGHSAASRTTNNTNIINDEDDEDPIVFDVINEPLLKNGRQVGTLECKIEAWWMNQFTSRSFTAVGGSGAPALAARRRGPGIDELRGDDSFSREDRLVSGGNHPHGSSLPRPATVGPATTVFSQRHPAPPAASPTSNFRNRLNRLSSTTKRNKMAVSQTA